MINNFSVYGLNISLDFTDEYKNIILLIIKIVSIFYIKYQYIYEIIYLFNYYITFSQSIIIKSLKIYSIK